MPSPVLEQASAIAWNVVIDGRVIGEVTKAQFGRGYFVSLKGITWQNAPGARYRADAGTFPKTHVSSLKIAAKRIEEALAVDGTLARIDRAIQRGE